MDIHKKKFIKAQMLDTLDKYEKWVLLPLNTYLQDQSANHFNVFIVLSVAIDNLASIRYLGEIPGNKKVGERYRKFIQNYMKDYNENASDLYEHFRCNLVHSFKLKKFELDQEQENYLLNLKKLESGNICLHSKRFFEDIYKAFKQLKKSVEDEDDSVLESFKTAYKCVWKHTRYDSNGKIS